MPDISMCRNLKCPLNKECFRFTATPSEYRQSYHGYTYDNGCKSFKNNKKKKR